MQEKNELYSYSIWCTFKADFGTMQDGDILYWCDTCKAMTNQYKHGNNYICRMHDERPYQETSDDCTGNLFKKK